MQVTLSNGLRVFLLEDHELPLVRGSLLMRGGQRARCGDMTLTPRPDPDSGPSKAWAGHPDSRFVHLMLVSAATERQAEQRQRGVGTEGTVSKHVHLATAACPPHGSSTQTPALYSREHFRDFMNAKFFTLQHFVA